jgi:hypothetical protein
VVTGQGEVTDLGLEIVQVTDLAQGTDRIGQIDLGLEIVQVTDLLLEVGTDPGAVADQVREQDQVHGQAQVQDRVQEQGQVHDQARVQDQVHGQAQVQDRVREQDQVHAQAQVQDRVRDKVVPEPVVEVPLVATQTDAPRQGTVSEVDPVVPANQEQDRQEVLRAGVGVEADQRAGVVDVAEVVVVAVAADVVVAVDVDLKWR